MEIKKPTKAEISSLDIDPEDGRLIGLTDRLQALDAVRETVGYRCRLTPQELALVDEFSGEPTYDRYRSPEVHHDGM